MTTKKIVRKKLISNFTIRTEGDINIMALEDKLNKVKNAVTESPKKAATVAKETVDGAKEMVDDFKEDLKNVK